MFRRGGEAASHFHIHDFTGRLQERLGFPVPELQRLEKDQREACVEGTPEAFVDALRTVVSSAEAHRGPNSWREPNQRALRNVDGIVRAIMDTAEVIVGSDANEENRGLAVAYTLFMMAVALTQKTGQRQDSFTLYRFAMLAKRMDALAHAAEDDATFEKVLARVREIAAEAEAACEDGDLPQPGVWSWFPANRGQLKLQNPAADGAGDGLSFDLCRRVVERLTAMYKVDGEFIRPDEAVDPIVAEEGLKLAQRDQRRAVLKTHLEAAFRELKLPVEIPVSLTVTGDGDGLDYSKATRCDLRVACVDGVPDFTARLSTGDQRNPLAQLLASRAGGGIAVIEFERR